MSSVKPTKEPLSVDPAIATKPNNVDALPSLLKEINTGVYSLVSGEPPGVLSAILFGVDCGLWKLMAHNGQEIHKVSELATALGVDTVLLSRFMRHLGTMGYLVEVDENEYKGTNFTKALSIPAIGNSYMAMVSGTIAGAIKFHEFSRQRAWQNPTDARDTALMYACKTDKDMFAWLESQGYGTHFNDHMGGYSLGRIPWMDPAIFPVQEQLIAGAKKDPNSPFLVDIGGSTGHDLLKFTSYFPKTPGRLILQDLPAVTRQIKGLDPCIQVISHNFFEEQPIKGARAYLLHSCLHDWPDSVCETILTHVKNAMTPGYSKLLICEYVISKTNAHWEETALDMIMLADFSANERTIEAWHHLVEDKVGLKIANIWKSDGGTQSLIECELA
ncbi:hypothetical protein CDD82_1538 [Ophiocordyceps australis]|uniref:O-methyltransferase C-terminal domain-containing protein n=1 Tax=Ophiocordyceps australis TaxID=1399860 RepID=A0A2C5ZI98_9HYPO|nr:hypothetical protein CDD82_1538 [Ophiocordyceps australis]